ncbi:28S ribosomal protein S15, mitochondrial [Megalops cyprinoides]|uniref:28S ribosomal protein S15, mitochondrial n=1 Tax=Megalops cyprinoides TaxID=118141 RepID=UPI001863F624|nr:28S ribosomal protein S15, mitochondrial [Megalops cyprinoides]
MILRCALKSASSVLRESSAVSSKKLNCAEIVSKHGAFRTVALPVRPLTSCFHNRWASDSEEVKGDGSFAVQAVRHYARATRRKAEIQSQLDDLPPTLLKKEYTPVPLAQTTDDVVRRLLTLELASHKEKLTVKKEQLVAKVRRHENDHSSTEVKVALLTARIRNYREHLQKHPKDKANKRRMLMAIDRRKKLLKYLRRTRYDTFEHVCQQLDITYTFPPEYYRKVTRRWLAKKALCIKVFKEVQKRKKEQRLRMRQAAAATKAETAEKLPAEVPESAA